MKIHKLTIIILGLCILLLCGKRPQELEAGEENALAVEQRKSFPVTKLSGVWVLDDWKQMYKFLGLSEKESYGYCMLIDERRGLAEAHFVKQIFKAKNVYTLTIKEIKEQRAGLWRIGFVYRGKSRWASISQTTPQDTHLHFDDSAPYQEGGGIYAKRDGSYFKAATIQKCAQQNEDDYKFDKANEGVQHDAP